MRYRAMIACVAAAVLAVGCGRSATVGEPAVVPEPVFMVVKEGSYTLGRNMTVGMTGFWQNSPTARYIMKSLRSARMRPMLATGGEVCDLEFVVLDTLNPELAEEGYLIEVRGTGVRLSANTEVGLFYAYQTFVQLLPADVSRRVYRSVTLPECTILDYPRYEWRGVHLDVSRHFFGVKFVKRCIDVMSMYKMNRFHWHLTDDHGWRLPSERWPRLNSVGSWRVDREGQPWGESEPAQEGERATYGGYYTREDVAEVVRYAAERGVEVVPEVELAGHSSAVLAAYPQLACDGCRYTVATGPYWPPRAILCAGNDSVLTFVDEIVDEVCELFPDSRYIHIGGGEAWRDNWKACPRCQWRIKEEGLKDEEGLLRWLMGRAAERVAMHGKVAVVWDEVAEGGRRVETVPLLPREADVRPAVMAWRGFYAGLEAARRGHRVVMCPADYCRFDCYQGDARYQPAAAGGMVTLARVYAFDPVPEGTGRRVAENVIGGQCNLWTEFVNTPSQAEYMLLPRLLAMSESLWSQRESKNWSRFRRKVEVQKERLAAKGYTYCEGSFTPLFGARRVDDTTTLVSIDTEVPNTYIFYTTDGSTPSRMSQVYIGPIRLRRGTHIKILPVYKDVERDSVYEFVIK